MSFNFKARLKQINDVPQLPMFQRYSNRARTIYTFKLEDNCTLIVGENRLTFSKTEDLLDLGNWIVKALSE